MQLRWKVLIVAGLLAAAAYGELIRDIRTPRALLGEYHAIGSNISIQMDEFTHIVEAMNEKYGPGAQTVLVTSQPARMITRVGNKVVAETEAPSRLAAVIGVYVIGPPGHLESTFPFRIDPRKALEPDRREPGARALQSRFGKGFVAKYLEFDDREAITDRCITLAPADLGGLGKLLQFQSGTFCVVFWKGASPSSMLVGVALADGDPWMRPFDRRICRWLMTTALARMAATDHEPPPDYAGCLLIDRPDRKGGTAAVLTTYVFDVRRDASLAYVN